MGEDVINWLKARVTEAARAEFDQEPEMVIVKKDRLRAGTGRLPMHEVIAWVKLKDHAHTVTLNLTEDGGYSNFQIEQ